MESKFKIYSSFLTVAILLMLGCNQDSLLFHKKAMALENRGIQKNVSGDTTIYFNKKNDIYTYKYSRINKSSERKYDIIFSRREKELYGHYIFGLDNRIRDIIYYSGDSIFSSFEMHFSQSGVPLKYLGTPIVEIEKFTLDSSRLLVSSLLFDEIKIKIDSIEIPLVKLETRPFLMEGFVKIPKSCTLFLQTDASIGKRKFSFLDTLTN